MSKIHICAADWFLTGHLSSSDWGRPRRKAPCPSSSAVSQEMEWCHQSELQRACSCRATLPFGMALRATAVASPVATLLLSAPVQWQRIVMLARECKRTWHPDCGGVEIQTDSPLSLECLRLQGSLRPKRNQNQKPLMASPHTHTHSSDYEIRMII